ncbi:hypothetical protein F2Q68_00031745 [Brassica cretica]|uniref:Uncharacterized protein n=1 Tax=Brassica cretica TaxID=69181 RepID=A0A8S9GBI9_BRACR|nr:hypothetical protein F2Q68_00031745 [Brassica cretica]
MALNNQRRATRHLSLGLADPQIIVPETAYAEAQQNNRRSLIARFRFCRNCGDLKHLKKSCTRNWVDVPDPNERALSPPPPDASFDGTAENNGERGTSSGTLEGELEPAGEDGEYQQTQGLDGVDGGDTTRKQQGF